MNSQDIFTTTCNFLYGPTLAGYFAKQFKKHGYDIDKLRNMLDVAQLTCSCTRKTEWEGDLTTKERAVIVRESINRSRLSYAPSLVIAIYTGLAVFGGDRSPLSGNTLLSLFAGGVIVLCVSYFVKVHLDRVYSRLADALDIIEHEK